MAAGDLTDLATAKMAANLAVTTGDTDQILGTLITAISAFVPGAISRNILSASYVETYQGNGTNQLLLRQRPVTAISLVEWQGIRLSQAGDAFAGSAGIWTDGRNACLVNYVFPQGAAVRISYTAGYASVPADISLAVAELVAEEYARRQHVGENTRSQGAMTSISYDTKAMHAAIAAKLQNYMHGAPC